MAETRYIFPTPSAAYEAGLAICTKMKELGLDRKCAIGGVADDSAHAKKVHDIYSDKATGDQVASCVVTTSEKLSSLHFDSGTSAKRDIYEHIATRAVHDKYGRKSNEVKI